MSPRETDRTEFTASPDATLSGAAAILCNQSASAARTPVCCGGADNPKNRAKVSAELAVSAVEVPSGSGERAEGKDIGRKEVSRCMSCRRRVGLTGFRCRCGELFCGVHRYSDRHECGFDYKAAGREAIARANPVVKAAKMVKI